MTLPTASNLSLVASVLAVVSGALLTFALLTLGLAIWHVWQVGHYGPTYLLAPLWFTASLLACSLAIVAASAWVWRSARTSAARVARLSSGALFATISAWVTFGVALFVLTHDWYAA